ncbi:MAG: hypothetical protein MJ171_06120 [Clostridia bacterium]|nr:hypothetical protein [Clostridia bacterium]
MALWNFAHSLGMHTYTLLSLGVVIVMAVIGLVHGLKQKNREDEYEYKLKKLDEKKQADK